MSKFQADPLFRGLIEEADDLSTDVLMTSLLVVHDTLRSGQDDVSELTAGEQVAGPHLNLVQLHIEAGRDAAALVQTTGQGDHDLSRAVVINHSDLTNVTYSITSIRKTPHPSSACTQGTSAAPWSKDGRAPDAYHASQRW